MGYLRGDEIEVFKMLNDMIEVYFVWDVCVIMMDYRLWEFCCI